MRIEKQMILAYATMAILGGVLIISIPFRPSQPMPESFVSTEPCTLDEEVARIESEIESRKAVLDAMLESAELVREPSVISTETAEIASETHETESEEESTTEEETSESEPITEPLEIFEPVPSMMAADLQAWVYAVSTEKGLDPYIIMAICERESCCTANIMGDSGRAYGMMQIHTVWVRDKMAAHGYTDADMLQAIPNITIGMEILQGYIATGNGLEWALMAYNGGPQSAGNSTTRAYAEWVINRANELRR